MIVKNLFHDKKMTCEKSFRLVSREGTEKEAEGIQLTEHVIEVYINDVLTMRLICSPEYLAELVAGRLLSEGLIRSSDEIEMLYICESGNRAKVLLNGRADIDTSSPSGPEVSIETIPTCCTENRMLTLYDRNNRELEALPPAQWKREWIFSLADRFARGTAMHQMTVSSHSCFLAKEDRILFECEDIGRHNAIDKAVGFAVLNSIDPFGCILYSSGRISTDMAAKVIRSRIPVLVSKGQATSEAIRMAGQYGLHLITGARPDQMKVFC